MEVFRNNSVSAEGNYYNYDLFFQAYQKNICSLLKKLRISRQKENKLRKYNKDLNSENYYLRDDIIRLEDSEDKVRDLLSEKTKRVNYLEGIEFNVLYKIQYRVKYNLDNEMVTSDWYDSEVEALEKVNKNTNNFIIEKHYKKRCWTEDDCSDDE
jgi:hypothetical protein